MEGIAQAIASTVNTGLNIGFGFLQQKKQNQYNLDQWQREVNYNNEMWEKNNAYNSPAAQMARYKDAGLNPNLIYGNAANTHSTSMTAPHAEQTAYNPSAALTNGLNMYMQLRQMAQNIKESESRIEKNDSEVTKNQTISDWNMTKNAYDLMRKTAYEHTDYFTSRGLSALNDVVNGSLQVQKNRLNNAWLASTLDGRIAAVDFQNKLWQSMASMNYAHRKLFNSQSSYIDSQHQFFNKTAPERYRTMTYKNMLTEEQILTEAVKRTLYQSRADYTDIKEFLAPFEFASNFGLGLGKLAKPASAFNIFK